MGLPKKYKFKWLISIVVSAVVFNLAASTLLPLSNDLQSFGGRSEEKIQDGIDKINWFQQRYKYHPYVSSEERETTHRHFSTFYKTIKKT